jgi:hypothetical protein
MREVTVGWRFPRIPGLPIESGFAFRPKSMSFRALIDAHLWTDCRSVYRKYLPQPDGCCVVAARVGGTT